MKLDHVVGENCIQWTGGVDNVGLTYSLKFKTVSRITELMRIVQSLIALAKTQTRLPADQSVSEGPVAERGKTADLSVYSKMVAENVSQNMELLTTHAHAMAKESNNTHVDISNVQQPLVLMDTNVHINISEVKIDNEPESVGANSKPRLRTNTELGDPNDDLPAATAPQQASSKDNLGSENEIANTATKNALQCSKADSGLKSPIGSMEPNEAEGLHSNSSHSVEVAT